MSRLRRVGVADLSGMGFVGGLRVQIAGISPRLRDRGDGVFEDELFLRTRLQQHGKLVKTPDSPRQLGAVQQVDDDGSLLAADRIEKRILNILRCLFAVRHVETRKERTVAIRLQHAS